MTLPTTTVERHLVWVCAGCEACEPSDGHPCASYPCDGPSQNGAWVVRLEDHEAQVERLLAALRAIAESPEPKSTLQVWAWAAYREGSS